ncbi:cell division protein ZapA (FtsZ GTPase activity inhibitor) [Rhabdobacter roseus]|uniref:Cell division protein ZapA (FtsZ GTPase activity inhibitor) n=2 Tax=Rhabdobacter roseus TaxID=1655419 RepID=A0A840TKA3_9BACT|nr:cell division protein ZapA (FtsZ GTPase activity inhibitor) [Rhabdobacter roseus]
MKRVAIHKKEGGHYDDLEAIALTSIECLVALQKAQEQLESLIAALEERVDHMDSSVTRALGK